MVFRVKGTKEGEKSREVHNTGVDVIHVVFPELGSGTTKARMQSLVITKYWR